MFQSLYLQRLAEKNPLWMRIYFPSILYGAAQNMLAPILPLYASSFAVSYALIGLMLAGESLGLMIADVPNGFVLKRLGTRRAMVWGVLGVAISTILLFWASSIWLAFGLRIVTGMSGSLYNIARHEYIAQTVIVAKRGKSIALYGGVHRLNRFIGPTVGATIAATFSLATPFLVMGVICFGVLAIVMTVVPRPAMTHYPTADDDPPAAGQFWTMVRANTKTFLTAGSGQIFVQMIRGGGAVILPLYAANELGLGVQTIGLILSLASGLDMLFFYPTGWIMDKVGRKYAIVPSFCIQALGVAVIPLTGDVWGLLGAALLIGFGNGLSAGTMMTLGADLAPPNARSEFLGVWRLIGDSGGSGGPLAVGFISAQLTLGASALVIAGTGWLAAFIFAWFVPETLKK